MKTESLFKIMGILGIKDEVIVSISYLGNIPVEQHLAQPDSFSSYCLDVCLVTSKNTKARLNLKSALYTKHYVNSILFTYGDQSSSFTKSQLATKIV